MGVGTTSPTFPLMVRTATATANTNVVSLANSIGDPLFQLNITRGATTNNVGDITTALGQGYNGGALTEAIAFHRGIFSTDGAIGISTNSTERIRIDKSGNVGIGLTTPLAMLDVKGGALIRGTNTNTPLTPVSAVELSIGRTNAGALNSGQTTADMAIQDGISGGGFRHFIVSRHNSVASSNGNGIDFYLNNSTTAAGSTAPGTGNVQIMSITATGVGIGTTTPVVPLQVNMATSSSPYSSTSVNVNFLTSTTTSGPTTSALTGINGAVAISAQGDVVAQGTITVASSVTYSDERIKDIIGQSDATKDLDVLNQIRITDYTMKDKMWWGNTPFKKVIAQQVEQVYPQAVSIKKDYIPNIYVTATKVEKTDNGYLITIDKALPELKSKKIKLEVQSIGMVEADLVSVINPNQFIVSTASDITSGEVFVFGEKVDDFRTVDYEAISMLNVSATQELTRKLKADEELIKQLKAENEQLKASESEQGKINKTMKAQIDAINEKLNVTGNK